jgi:carbon monoxide dehydrogenase subunit G
VIQLHGNHDITNLCTLDITSKIGTIPGNVTNVYNFLSDFNNFQQLIPRDKVKDWTSSADSCQFTVEGLGTAGLRIIEREPGKLIKITTEEGSSLHFILWIQLKEHGEQLTTAKVTMRAELNPMFAMIAKKPLEHFVNTLIDQMAGIHYP